MPSVSPAQHRLMEGVAHSPEFARKVGIPQKVGQDYAAADEAGEGRKRKKLADALQNNPKRTA